MAICVRVHVGCCIVLVKKKFEKPQNLADIMCLTSELLLNDEELQAKLHFPAVNLKKETRFFFAINSILRQWTLKKKVARFFFNNIT